MRATSGVWFVSLCLGLLRVVWAGNEELGEVRILANDQVFRANVTASPYCPTNTCHENTYTSFADMCERVEFSLWNLTEQNCRQINQRADISSWHHSSFTFYQNIRAIRLTSSAKLLVAFDIVGPKDAIGNWWRVMLRSSSHTMQDTEPIQVAGRVIDQWNGNYTVYLHLPTPGVYELDILLEYMGCNGYPDDFTRRSALNRYVGNYITARIEWNSSKSIPSIERSPAIDTFRYLADTGYYHGEVWHASDMARACLPQPKLPRHLNTMSFIGDSTMVQLYRCVVRQGRPCPTTECVRNQENMLNHCASIAQTSGTNGITIAQRQFWYSINSTSNAKHVAGANADILRDNSSLLLMNAGLHPISKPWEEQKHSHHVVASALMSAHRIHYVDAAKSLNGSYFIWRDTWSVHEYCFVRNTYWENEIEHAKGAPWFDANAYRSHLHHMRDASIDIQRSHQLDVIVRGTEKAFWLPSQWLSRAWFKRKGENDMRHHNEVVLIALWKELLKMFEE